MPSAPPNLYSTARGSILAATRRRIRRNIRKKRFLDDFVPDVAFVGTNGLTVERGATTPEASEAAAKRAMIRTARRAVLLADHTRSGRSTSRGSPILAR